MHLDTDAELTAYRAEVAAFVRENAPARKHSAGVRAPEPEQLPALRAWTAQLFDAGYLGGSWPAEYGGQAEKSPQKAFVVAEELARARSWGQIGAGSLAAAALLSHGSAEQKAHFLPRIRSGQDLWCQLFSEPEAGSDLASLRTRARPEGEEYVIDGQKVWTTNGQHADVGYLLARTDPRAPKRRGISAFALDMRSPGVQVRPLREITGTTDFNEVFMDEVRVPRSGLIGEPGEGWKVANASLGQERTSVAAHSAELLNDLDDLIRLASGGPADGALQARLGRVATHARVVDLMSKQVAAGLGDPIAAAVVKIAFSETNLAAVELGMDLQAERGLLVQGDPEAGQDGYWPDAYLYARAYTIAGGANEVLRNVVAERGLGLPR